MTHNVECLRINNISNISKMSKSKLTFGCIKNTNKNTMESSKSCEIWRHFRGGQFIFQSLVNRNTITVFRAFLE